MEYRKAFVNGLRINYAIGGKGPLVVMLHGFPETHRQWRHIAPALAERFTVVTPDYRGAGGSDRPAGGYDKRTMASDIALLIEGLAMGPAIVVGHDIGMMVGYALAANHRNLVTKFAALDAPLPGTAMFERIFHDPRAWHMPFHCVPDVPEMLIAGREREYLSTFFHSKTMNSAAFSQADIDEYAKAYSMPGAMRAGIEIYRAFKTDVADNRESMKRKLEIPVLALGGVGSAGEGGMREMMLEVATNVDAYGVPGSGHFVAEENPAFVTKQLLAFAG